MFGFLGKSLVGQIAVPVAIGLVVWLGVAKWNIRGLERDLSDERAAHAITMANYRTCTGNVETLEAAIEDQNARVDALAAAGEAMNARVAEAVEAVRRATAGLDRRAADLVALADGPPPADACEAALRLIREP